MLERGAVDRSRAPPGETLMFAPADVARQALDVSKATFDNVYFTSSALQRMAEDALLDTARQAPWLPEELQGVLREWVGLAQRTRKDVKDTVDRCHVLLHALVDRASPGPAPAETAGTATATVTH
jgi:hypothetical protein